MDGRGGFDYTEEAAIPATSFSNGPVGLAVSIIIATMCLCRQFTVKKLSIKLRFDFLVR